MFQKVIVHAELFKVIFYKRLNFIFDTCCILNICVVSVKSNIELYKETL